MTRLASLLCNLPVPTLWCIPQTIKQDANAKDFVAAFPGGLSTDVGKLGSKLSGGQRQRIAMARLFARRNSFKILLLDEPTAVSFLCNVHCTI